MGSRDPAKAAEWSGEHGERASHGTFRDAAELGELVFNCTAGAASVDALEQAGEDALRGKVLIDVSNPLDFSRGFPPSLLVSNTDSLAERIQREFPAARVVKSLNTMTAALMVDPTAVAAGDHVVFVSGDDADAKQEVAALLRDGWGWKHVVDLGDLSSARAAEMYLPLWVRLLRALDTPMFNISLVR
jgi:predicted dinucleotide-binding enzyme